MNRPPYTRSSIYLQVVMVCLCSIAWATHFRGAHMWWKPIGIDSRKVQISFRIGWRGNYSMSTRCDSAIVRSQELRGPTDTEPLKCVVNCYGTVGTMRFHCTDFSVRENWVAGKNSYPHTFPGHGIYQVSWTGKGWLSTLQSGADQPWEIRMTVDLRLRKDKNPPSVNRSPVSASQPVVRLQYGCNQTIHVPVTDDDKDIVRCRWAEDKRKECGGICGPVAGSIIDPNTCQIRFVESVQTGWYAVAIQLEDFATASSNQPLSSVPLQFLVHIYNSSSACNTKPEIISPPYTNDECIPVKVNQLYHLRISARTRDDKISITEINTVSQKGMIKTPVTKDPVEPRVYYVNITWIAQTNQTTHGSMPFCYSATDSTGVSSDQKCFTIAIGATRPVPGKVRVLKSNTHLLVTFDQPIRPPRTAKPRKVRILSATGSVLQQHQVPNDPSVIFDGPNMKIKFTSTQKSGAYSVDMEFGAARSNNYCGVESVAARLPYNIVSPTTAVITTEPTTAVITTEPTTAVITMEPTTAVITTEPTTTKTPTTGNTPCDTSYLKMFKVYYHGFPYCIQVTVAGETSTMRSPGGGKGLKFDGKGYVKVTSGDFGKTCFGNLKLCTKGFTTVAWIKFPDDKNRSVICTGGASDAKIFNFKQTVSKGLHVMLRAGDKLWTVRGGKSDMKMNSWSHIAISWTEKDGALLYINGKRVGCGDVPVNTLSPNPVQEYRIARSCDNRGTYGKLAMYDLHFWDKSLPWTEILHRYKKGSPYVFTRDPIIPANKPFPKGGGHWYQGSPPDVCGYRGKGVKLDGKAQFVTLGTHAKTCVGDPTYCENGITLSFWIKMQDQDGLQCMVSSGGQEAGSVGLSVCYDKAVGYSVHVRTKEEYWLLKDATKIPGFQIWTNIVVTWNKDQGLALYQNGKQLSAVTTTGKNGGSSAPKPHAFTLGKNSQGPNDYFRGMIDQLYYWEVYMNSSEVANLYAKSKCVRVSMDEASGALIGQGNVSAIIVGGKTGNTPGVCNAAVTLNETQYIRIHMRTTKCLGNFSKCIEYTVSLWVKVLSLDCSRYILSSGGEDANSSGVSLRYLATKGFIAHAKTKSRSWTLNTQKPLKANVWYHVILAWTSQNGMKMYLNGTLVGYVNQATAQTASQNNTGKIYIGRPFYDTPRSPKGCKSAISVDELQMCDKEKFPEDFGNKYEAVVVPTPEPSSSSHTDYQKDSLTWIIYPIIGVVVFLVLLAIVILVLMRRNKENPQSAPAIREDQDTSYGSIDGPYTNSEVDFR